MDPSLVIAVMGLHLAASGALMLAIGTRRPGQGLGYWGVAGLLFGGAYLARLLPGLATSSAGRVLLDTAMLSATVLYAQGLRQFCGRRVLPRRLALGLLAAFAAAAALALHSWGLWGRHVLLNASLTLAYAVLTAAALRELGRQPPGARAPLTLLALQVGGLALLTLLRTLQIAGSGLHRGLEHGLDHLYDGLLVSVYYGYSSLVAVLLGVSLLWLVFERITRELADLAARDALTRALNRHGLDDALRRHFALRHAPPLVLLAVDIDHFKRINDQHGHGAGDQVLRAVADALAAHLRGHDLVARVGGEEFLVVCATPERAQAAALAERLRAAVAALPLQAEGATLHCTVSIGVSPLTERLDDLDAAARAADQALYAAKAAGRNRVVLAD
ncbi:MAG: GGDEF domain-containing protein [Burkholderiaceae bacterium]|nr:GGDEF domain-containing protein [Burkholderiaceae bacterium]